MTQHTTLDLIKKLQARKPDFNLKTFNFLHPKNLNKLKEVIRSSNDVESKGQEEIDKHVNTLKGLQRLVKLTKGVVKHSKLTNSEISKDKELAINLHSRGLHSAYQIASMSEKDFIEQHAEVFEEDDKGKKAKKFYANAKAVKHKTILDYLAIKQANEPHYKTSRFSNLQDSLAGFPNYNELFNLNAFCTCPDCRTILSAAAYFFDLMRVVNDQGYVTVDTSKAKTIAQRRPDLSRIVLSCDNTNTEMSKLEIINTILQETISPQIDLRDLPGLTYPFNLPFDYDLARIRTYLDQNKTDLPEIWQSLNLGNLTNNKVRNLEILKVSSQAWAIYKTPVTDSDVLATMYGVTISDLNSLNNVDTFLQLTGLSYDNLAELLFEDLSTNEIANKTALTLNKVFVNYDLDLEGVITKDVSAVLKKFTLINFDRANRFIRLAQDLGWSFTDLDWLITSINNALNLEIEITDAILPYLAWAKTLKDDYNLSINQICGFIGSLKTYGRGNGQSFFEQVFEGPNISKFPNWSFDSQVIWNVLSLNGTNKNDVTSQDQEIQGSLAAALKISILDLLIVANTIIANTQPDDQALIIGMSGVGLKNLTLLYRLSLVPKIANLSLIECMVAYSFKPVGSNNLDLLSTLIVLSPGQYSTQIAQSYAVIDNLTSITNWLSKQSLSVGQVQYWLTGQSIAPTIQNNVLGTNAITNFQNQLATDLSPVLLTLDQFISSVETLSDSLLLSSDQVIDIFGKVSNIKINNTPIIDDKGVIHAVPTVEQIASAIESIIQNDDFNTAIRDIIVQGSALQQTKFYASLASLYNTDQDSAKAFAQWADLSVADFDTDDTQVHLETGTLVPLDNLDLIAKLRKIQSYNSFVSTAKISADEANSFNYNPNIIGGTAIESNIANILKSLGIGVPDAVIARAAMDTLPVSFNTGAGRTISSWVSLTNVDRTTVLMRVITGDFEVIIGVESGKLLIQANGEIVDQEIAVQNNEMFQLTLVLDSSFSLYFNGVKCPSSSQVKDISRVNIGQNAFPGFVEQIINFPKVLTASQVALLHTLNFDNSGPKYLGPDILKNDSFGALQNLTFDTVQKLYSFKALTKQYGDSQNNFLNYLAFRSTSDLQKAAQLLAKTTNWDANSLLILMQSLAVDSSVELFSVEGLTLLGSYYDIADNLNINSQILYSCSKPANFQSNKVSLANALWAALQAKYADDQDTLTGISNSLSNQLRDRLVPLVIYILNQDSTIATKYQINNARDLYEYLLIDVEVDAIVETSRIVEATNAIQLYLYRCRNGLEQGVVIDSRINDWWEWIISFRVWQANREVFLYPENYIDPSLRKGKTALFTTLENSISQVDLTDTSAVDTALVTYLDSVVNIANMKIISSATYSTHNDGDTPYQNFMIIGQTNEQPRKYYYSLAVFANNGSQGWTQVSWSQWKAIDTAMTPVGGVSSAFAGNRWYISWVEAKQTGADENNNPTYTLYINYSYLNSSDSWVAANQIEISGIAQSTSSPTATTISAHYQQDAEDRDYIVDVAYNNGSTPYVIEVISNIPKTLNLPASVSGELSVDNSANLLPVVVDSDSDTFENVPILNSWKYSIPSSGTIGAYIRSANINNNNVSFLTLPYIDDTGSLKLSCIRLSSSSARLLSTNLVVGGVENLLSIASQQAPEIPFSRLGPNLNYFRTLPSNTISFSDGPMSNYYWEIFFHIPFLIAQQLQIQQQFESANKWFNYIFNPTIADDTTANSNYLNDKYWRFIELRSNNNPLVSTLGLDRLKNSLNNIGINSTNAEVIFYADGTALPISDFSVSNTFSMAFWCSISNVTIDSQILCIEQQGNISATLGVKSGNLYFSNPDQVDIPLVQVTADTKFHVGVVCAPGTNKAVIYFNGTVLFSATISNINVITLGSEPTQSNNLVIQDNIYLRDNILKAGQVLALYNLPIIDSIITFAKDFEIDSTDSGQLYIYHEDPFDPHAIAMLRPIAYQKALVMSYIKNLIAWGDYLYNQYTSESITEATMLYVEASDLLGKKPIDLGPCSLPADTTFEVIEAQYNDDSAIPEFIILEQSQNVVHTPLADISPVNDIPNAYFGLPENDQFTTYWNTISGRLYNIRHGLTIDGVFLQVPLFAPPINPNDLIAQVASGTSLAKALVGLQTPTPYYRFKSMAARAKEITGFVVQLGGSILAALEKKDAEGLSLLYSANQQNILNLTKRSRESQVNDVQETLGSLNYSLKNAKDRVNHYNNLINKALIGSEIVQMTLKSASLASMVASLVSTAIAGGIKLAPNVFGFAFGGSKYSGPAEAAARVAGDISQNFSISSDIAGTTASFQRREQDWQLQLKLSQDDLEQIQHQIKGAQYQKVVAENEQKINLTTLAQEEKVERYLLSKFSNQQLYQWMSGKLASLYFQAYQLAYNTAKKAEAAWMYERAITMASPMIQSGNWNNLYQGLLAGEGLMLNIYRMEQAYVDQDKRRLEISKVISLATDPNIPQQSTKNTIFETLKATGSCAFTIPNSLFDLDYSGHYSRLIKNISISLPALLGPYQTICATLQQTSSSYFDVFGNENSIAAKQTIALSQGMNDTGMVSSSMGDEERYMPFESTGAVSSWLLTITNYDNNPEIRTLIQNSLTDVIIELNYTALAGGSTSQKKLKTI